MVHINFQKWRGLDFTTKNPYFISDHRQEQQNDSAPELSGANRSPGFPDLHRDLQSVRQTHEFDPRRLRGVQEDPFEEFQSAGARGKACSGLRTAARREHSFPDGGRSSAAGGGSAPSSHSGSSSWPRHRSCGRTRSAHQHVRCASGSPRTCERRGRTRPAAHGSYGTGSAPCSDDGCPATGHDSRRHALDAGQYGTRRSSTDAWAAAKHDPRSTTTGQGWLLDIQYKLIKLT